MNIKNKNLIDGLLTIYEAKIKRFYNKPLKPRVISYSVTWRCNARCSMCGLLTTDNSFKDISQELTARQIGDAFCDRSLNSLDLIRFTGGEPFLKNDFTEIVYQIWKNARPKLFYITTNGFFTDKIKDFVTFFNDKDIKLSIHVSLDAVSEIHDKIRGVAGLANKAVETLETLATLRKRIPLNIGINQTITKENINEIETVNQLAKRMGIEHKVYIAVDPHESKILSNVEKSWELKLAVHYTENEKKQLYEKIKNILQASREFRGITDVNYIWHLVEKFLLEGNRKRILKEGKIVNLPCMVAFLYCRLLPNGDVMPCTMMPEAIGNIKEQSFSEIWYSEKADSIRKQVKCCPGCWVECDVVSNFIYSDYMLKYFMRDIGETLKKSIPFSS
ncbi:MAG: radical SAM protein [Deltaproteobacteria bacterium]|nr:radical SAM protein [Deltaproteobacteria bacterium]